VCGNGSGAAGVVAAGVLSTSCRDKEKTIRINHNYSKIWHQIINLTNHRYDIFNM
jgi:hypothetical protein